jgi:hypothetical protein
MDDGEREQSGRVDRRAFLTGAGKRSIARAAFSGGLLGRALQRAGEHEPDSSEPEEDEDPAGSGTTP